MSITNFTATQVAENAVRFNWSFSTEYVSGSLSIDGEHRYSKLGASGTYRQDGLPDGEHSATLQEYIYPDGVLISTRTINFSVLPKLPTPSTFTATALSSTSISLAWSFVANAATYTIIRSSPTMKYWSAPGATTSITDSECVPGTTYNYIIRAYNDGNYYRSDSKTASATTFPKLSTPTGLAESHTESSVTISWDVVSNATGYNVYRGSTLLGSVSSTSYTDNTTTTGSSYTYYVEATASGYDTSDKASINVYVNPKLSTPTGLSAAYTVNSTTVSWDAVQNASLYKLWRDSVYIGSQSSRTFVDTTAGGAGTSHTYSVVASASNYYDSDPASISTTNPPQLSTPTGLSASYTQTSTTIAWNAVTSATGYNIYIDGSLIGQTTETSYTNSGAAGASGQQHTYGVVAYASGYYNSNAATISALNPSTLATPTNLSASYTQSSTTLSWTAVIGVASYKVYRGNTLIGSVNTTTYTDNSGGSGTSYTYKIIASNSPAYYDSSPASITTNNPNTLASVVISSVTQTVSSVTLAWGAVTNAQSYTVSRDGIVLSTASSLSYADSTTIPSTNYTYSIVAKASGYYDSAPTTYAITIKPQFPAPSMVEATQGQNSVTLSIDRQYSSGTLILLRDGVQIATDTPSGTNTWLYTDSGVDSKQNYVYSAYTQGTSSIYASNETTLVVYVGRDYTNIERQRSYLRTIPTPFTKLCRLRFLYPNGTTAYALDSNIRNKRSKAFIQDGTVNANMQNGQRLTATVTLANAEKLYDFNINKVWFGQEIALDEGLVLPNGEEYWRQTGVFIIDNPQETINPDTRTVTYNLVDKWADLDGTLDGNLEGTYEVPVSTNIYNPIAALLDEDRGNGRKVDYVKPVFTEYFNSKTQELPDGSTVSMVLSPYTLTVDGDGGTIGEVVLGLGGMVNAWIGYDNTGRLRIEPSQDDILDAQKAVLYRFTPEEVTLLGLAYTIKKEELFNDYIVVGEQLDDYSQPGGRAQNLDPRSDTNVNIIGRKTKRESASGFATVQQCKDLAEWRLKRSGVLQKAVNISCSQMFHIELNSLVEIVRTDKPGSPTERHLIQGYSRPLANNGAMTITAVSVNDFPMATVTEWPPSA